MNDKTELIENNLRLVHSCCKRFVGRGIEYDDLYQAGCLGLIKAANGFDTERGLMFSTYAVPAILGEIKRLFRDGGAVKVSRSLKELSLKVSREKEKLEAQSGKEITVEQLAECLSVKSEEIVEALCVSRQVISLTYEGEDGICELELEDKGHEDTVCGKIHIEQAIEHLEELERKIIQLRFFHEKTQSESAKLLGISQVQVSRKEKKSLEKLRLLMSE